VAGPSATVTFLLTDIEGSTRVWHADEVAMRAAVRTRRPGTEERSQ